MSEEEKTKCAIALDVSLGMSHKECQSTEEFAYYIGTTLLGLAPQEIPKKQDCRRIFMRTLSRRNYQQILVYVLCVLMQELENGKTFQEAITFAWKRTKEKIGE